MEFCERELEDWLYANPEAIGVEEWIGRQLLLPSGILDLVGITDVDCPGYLLLVELKSVPLKSSAITQVCRYAADLEKLPGVVEVSKLCIGTGQVSDELLYAAQAVDVELRSVEPSFSVSGSWSFTDAKRERDRLIRKKLACENLWFRRLALQTETCRSIYKCAGISSEISDSLLLDFARDFQMDISYRLQERTQCVAEEQSA